MSIGAASPEMPTISIPLRCLIDEVTDQVVVEVVGPGETIYRPPW
jgi:hypothetical protein